jgi:hypothetical protein
MIQHAIVEEISGVITCLCGFKTEHHVLSSDAYAEWKTHLYESGDAETIAEFEFNDDLANEAEEGYEPQRIRPLTAEEQEFLRGQGYPT